MKLPLSVWFEVDAETKKCRHIIRDADGRKVGDYGSKRTALNQMRKHTAMIKIASDDFAEYAWLGL